MLEYDFTKELYLVQVTDSDWNGVKRQKTANGEKMKLPQFWVPRIRLMFLAEDPQIFAERIKEAYEQREKTESLIRLVNIYFGLEENVAI